LVSGPLDKINKTLMMKIRLDGYVIGWYNRANIFGRKNVIQISAKKQPEIIKGVCKEKELK